MQDGSTDGWLILDGELTVRNGAEIRAALLDKIDRHPSVSIDCSAAAAVDLSFIQLLIAARNSAERAGTSVTLAPRPAGAMLDALTRGGFHLTQDAQTDSETFWFDGAAL